jgi:hypothetical protein
MRSIAYLSEALLNLMRVYPQTLYAHASGAMNTAAADEQPKQEPKKGPKKNRGGLAMVIEAGLLKEGAVLRYMKVLRSTCKLLNCLSVAWMYNSHARCATAIYFSILFWGVHVMLLFVQEHNCSEHG